MAQPLDRQAALTAGVTPALGQQIGGGAADPQHLGRLLDGQEFRQVIQRTYTTSTVGCGAPTPLGVGASRSPALPQ